MIGLVVNPVAGLGGPAGLKGSDGSDVQLLARERGAVERSDERAQRVLSMIARSYPDAVIMTAGGAMGESAVRAAGLDARVVYVPETVTTAADTTAAAAAIAATEADLLLFVGGDGTARDVCSGLPAGFAALGVPAGVKMYSSCFAVSPAAAGAMALAWLDTRSRPPLREREVLDVVEEQLRVGRVDPRLFGTMMVPYLVGRTQARKAAMPASGHEAVVAAARGLAAKLCTDGVYLLGPGSTVAEVAKQCGVVSTPLGVDVMRDGRIVIADASEHQLLDYLATVSTDVPVKAIITVIGGQGFLLGRGNQQISAAVLRRLGPDPLLVVATESKLIELAARPLLVDTGDRVLDRELTGYVKVVTGQSSTSIYSVEAPENEGAQTCV
ncbi:MAG: NAD(+)/NADH kinase [Lacisediminihabitans sp.]